MCSTFQFKLITNQKTANCAKSNVSQEKVEKIKNMCFKSSKTWLEKAKKKKNRTGGKFHGFLEEVVNRGNFEQLP